MTPAIRSKNLRAGRTVFATLIASPRWLEVVSGCGLDFVIIDTEYIAIDKLRLDRDPNARPLDLTPDVTGLSPVSPSGPLSLANQSIVLSATPSSRNQWRRRPTCTPSAVTAPKKLCSPGSLSEFF